MSFDSAISIKTGLERAGVAGPFVGPDLCTTCTERVDRQEVC